MFRYVLCDILHDLEWGIAFVIATLILFLIIPLLAIKPAIANITETDLAPGQIHCHSEQLLNDEAGHFAPATIYSPLTINKKCLN